MSLSVSVIIAAHDRQENLLRTVEAVLRQDTPPAELVIVNDGREEVPAGLAVAARAAGVRYLHARLDRPCLPASRNRGMDLAGGGDIMLLMDDDVTLPGDYIRRLTALYEADTAGVIDGIGGVLVQPGDKTNLNRLWEAMAAVFADNAWGPRRVAARYVTLPASLRGRLQPARWLAGGLISLRRRLADERFAEGFGGYALAEDIEFCFRVGRRRALFLSPDLQASHDRGATGRPEQRALGRSYAANMLHVARNSVEGGAGTWLMLGYHLAGTLGMHMAWHVATAGRRPGHREFATGLAGGLTEQLRIAAGGLICGR